MSSVLCRVTIDGRSITVPSGTSVLKAARQLGIDIPTLCFLDGFKPQTSCLVCTVKVIENGQVRMVPSCGTPVSDGMVVESETDEVAHVRRTALELLLSDHLGDCLAPCHFACPAHMDIPTMLRQIQREELREAIATIKRDIALPATLGWVCPRPCEKGCRRNAADDPVAVCSLKRYVAEWDLASGDPYLPPCQPDSGKTVAVVGAGPTGLSAAFYLRQLGHRVVLFEANEKAGGRVRFRPDPGGTAVPPAVLAAEIDVIFRLGVEFRSHTPLVPPGGNGITLQELQNKYEAVLLALGEQTPERLEQLGIPHTQRGITINRETFQTPLDRVFAAGNAIRGRGLVVRSCADGKLAARCIDQFLRLGRVEGVPEMFSVRMGRLEREEVEQLATLAEPIPRIEPPPGGHWEDDLPVHQAGRCLHCDCRALPHCRLREYAIRYQADPNRFRGERAKLEIIARPSGIIYEPGKCILCGLCVEVTEAARAPLGLTFVGRGFDVRIGVPFDRTLEEALGELAEQVVAICPTGALSFREGKPPLHLPVLNTVRDVRG